MHPDFGILPILPSLNDWPSGMKAGVSGPGGDEILDAAIELCRKKGYSVLYAHSQKRFSQGVGKQRGFRRMGRPRNWCFSDFDYVEVKLETQKHPQSITLSDDPYVINSPRGAVGITPGILERSASRGVGLPAGRLMSTVIDLRTYVSSASNSRLLVMVDLQEKKLFRIGM